MRSAHGKACPWVCCALIASLGLSGCTNKGYITAAVQSVIGLDVSENPQTQVPHVRFGFARSQLYYIPTGKTTEGSGNTSQSAGNASDTPTLVSDINVDITPLKQIVIKERFAVGQGAVHSLAAQALFQEAVREQLIREHTAIDDIMKYVDTGGNVDGAKLAKLIPGTGLDQAWVNRLAGKPVSELRKELEGPFRRVVSALAANIKS